MDSAITPGPSDTRTDQVELPVNVDDLAIDGTAPEVGDSVDVKMKGSVTRVINSVAWIKPESINDKPLPEVPMEKNDDLAELDRQYQMSQQPGGGSVTPSY